MIATTDTPNVETAEDRTSFLEVLGFVWDYWRTVPVRFAGMLVGTSVGVLLEIQIPRISADFVVATERQLQGATDSSAAWGTAWLLLGTFAAVFVV